MKSGSDTAARLETLTSTFLDTRQYHITVTNLPVSMILFTIFPTEALPRIKRFNHSAKAVSARP